MFSLGEWYSCRGLAVVANSGVEPLGFNCEFLARLWIEEIDH